MSLLTQRPACSSVIRVFAELRSGALLRTTSIVSKHTSRNARSISSSNGCSQQACAGCVTSSTERRTGSELSVHTSAQVTAGGIDSIPRGELALNCRSWRKRPSPGWRLASSRVTGTDTSTAADRRSYEGRALSTTSERKCSCWKCEALICCHEFLCSCGAVQPLGGGRVDYFEMFKVKRSVCLDLKELDRNFKNMQRAFHPDLFANKSPEEQQISSANSSIANKAYQTLSQPMRRVKYLNLTARLGAAQRTFECPYQQMRVLGSSALEEEGTTDDIPSVPPAFLMEVMETREHLENCSTKAEAESVLQEARSAANDCLQKMDVALKTGGGKDELADEAIRLRYLHRIEEEARSIVHRFEDEEHTKRSTVDGA